MHFQNWSSNPSGYSDIFIYIGWADHFGIKSLNFNIFGVSEKLTILRVMEMFVDISCGSLLYQIGRFHWSFLT